MERLTARINTGDYPIDEIAFINPDDPEGMYNIRDIVNHGSDELLYEIANRLAQYEDTGLSPKEITKIVKMKKAFIYQYPQEFDLLDIPNDDLKE